MADKQQGQQADPQEQRMFETASKQAAKALMTEQGARAIYRDAKVNGPDSAIASAVQRTISGIAQAAKSKGVQIPPAALQAAMQAVAQVLVALMVQSGLAKDAEQLMAAVMKRMQVPA